jgi:hypothetical protein
VNFTVGGVRSAAINWWPDINRQAVSNATQILFAESFPPR